MPVPFLLRVLMFLKSPFWVAVPARLIVLGLGSMASSSGSSVPRMAVVFEGMSLEPVSRLTVRAPRAPG